MPLVLVALLLPATARAAEIVKDGSFESTPATEDNPNWEEFSLRFGTPICDRETCTTVSGDPMEPRTGNGWVWFGGTPSPEEAYVAQPVTIPPGAATLTFYVWIGGSGNPLDAFRVFMGEEKIFELFSDEPGYDTYTLVTVDVSKYAGVGGPHTLSFEFQGFGPAPTNISLDDISLQSGRDSGAGSVTLRGPKKVAQGKKAKLKASVQPCAGHAGETIDLFRGKKKIASAMASGTCTAKFKVRIKRTSKFRAVSPAGTSNTLKVRVRRR